MIYAIGDIHGQRTMLHSLLDMLERTPLHDDDHLVFLGDYVDRGEDTCGVIDTLINLRNRHPNTVFLRGNHEEMMLEARRHPEVEHSGLRVRVQHSDQMLAWLQNGGVETLFSYSVRDFRRWWETIPPTHWDFLESTRLEFVTDGLHFVHAGLVPPGETWDGEEWGIDPRFWIREPFLSSDANFGGRLVVFGHTPQATGKPLMQKNKIGLDTAAVYGGPLTAAGFETDADGVVSVRLFQTPHAPSRR